MSKARCKLLLLLCIMSSSFIAYAQPEQEVIPEIIVTGKVPGPPLWQVINGENTLWIFGALTPLPKSMIWDNNRVERVIADADEYLSAPIQKADVSPTDVLKVLRIGRMERNMQRLNNGERLTDVLNSELYQRMLVVKEEFGPRTNGLLKLRPAYAATKLSDSAFKRADLEDSTDGIERRINRLIRRYDVPVTSSSVELDIGDEFEEIRAFFAEEKPMDVELDCLLATLDMIENDLTTLEQRANDWANGYIDDLYNNSFTHWQHECEYSRVRGGLIQDIFQNRDNLWMQNAQRALNTNHSTFAVLPMMMMTAADGLLERLRDQGYEVVEP